jgi:uncharacterized protein YjbI with pentapeptide repeats
VTVQHVGACRYMNRLGARCRIQEVRANLGAMPLDFSGRDLEGANLRGANLRGSILVGATLNATDLTGANLTAAFRRPGLSCADLEGATGLDTVPGLVD